MKLTPKGVAFVRDELIPALESGEYKKGKSRLHTLNDDSWCCLGVACDLLDKNGHVALERKEEAYDTWSEKTGRCEVFNNSFGGLPYAAQNYLGICSQGELQYAGYHGLGSTLAGINDNNDTFEPVVVALRGMVEQSQDV
jgi:hypothetical protein